MSRYAIPLLLVAMLLAACSDSSDSSRDPSLPTATPASTTNDPTKPESGRRANSDGKPGTPQGEKTEERYKRGGEASMREEDVRRPVAPIISGTDLDGNPLSLEDFKGTPVIVKVYAKH